EAEELRRMGRGLPRKRIAPIEIGEKSLDLAHPLTVRFGESFPKPSFHSLEDPWPENDAAYDQERSAPRPGQQQAAGPGADQKDPDLLRHRFDPLCILGDVRRLNRLPQRESAGLGGSLRVRLAQGVLLSITLLSGRGIASPGRPGSGRSVSCSCDGARDIDA